MTPAQEPAATGPQDAVGRAAVRIGAECADSCANCCPCCGRVALGTPPAAARRPAVAAHIQLRVVATTLLLSLGVVLMLGIVVIGQVRNGLLEAKTKAAQGQALGGFSVAQPRRRTTPTRRTRAPPTDPGGGTTGSATATGHGQVDPGTWLTDLVQQLASGGQGVYYVVALQLRRRPAALPGGQRRHPRPARLRRRPARAERPHPAARRRLQAERRLPARDPHHPGRATRAASPAW